MLCVVVVVVVVGVSMLQEKKSWKQNKSATRESTTKMADNKIK